MVIVQQAIRALNTPELTRKWRVTVFTRTDSGTVVTLVPARPKNPRTVIMGGGGVVWVPTYIRPCVIERFR